MITAEEFVKKFGKEKQRDSVIYGKVSEIGDDGKPHIIIDGETVASVKRYPFISTYNPKVDDRVMITNGIVMGGIGGQAEAPSIYGVKIDTLNSNPETAVSYIDDAEGFIPARGNNGSFQFGSWEDKFPFNQIKPCVLKSDTSVNYYLNPNDYTKKEDNSPSDITSGNDGDVMVEFPIVYWNIETVGTNLFVRYTDRPTEGFKALAHTRGDTEKEKCYISAYLGSNISSRLRSLSGKTPTGNLNIGSFRTLAKANGTNYDQMAYYQLLMLQVLFLVMFKNRNSQIALGRGYVDGNSVTITTGGTNAKGLFYGETTGKLQNKFCGIEDMWGNLSYWIDGFYTNVSRTILIGNHNFNNTGVGYENFGIGAASDLAGYVSNIQGSTETGFVGKAFSGSATTYYSDAGSIYASRLMSFGGYFNSGNNGGFFALDVYQTASVAGSSLGSRIFAL